ncbi:purine-nucleoside phosphorylase [candidate division WOR-3 bacterium]|nr:purine-nucleoside phosphorylase [candidate division WOR-3 bacterium]
MTLHLRAEKGDYAPTVLLVGDPGRAEIIGNMFDDPRCVARNRGLIGYTGIHNGTPVSVQTTGMGCPSAGIVVEELIQIGVRHLIRIGTCGGIGKGIKPLDMVAAISAAPFDGATRTYVNREPVAPYASFTLLNKAYDVAQAMHIPLIFTGVASVDVFYNPFPDYIEKLRRVGAFVVEMETSLIYHLANRNNIDAASFLLVSDIVGKHEDEFTTFVTDKDLAAGMEKLIALVLSVVTKL